MYRLKGDLLLASASTPADTRHTWAEAEPCFHQALTVARGQQARALELRAALSLSRLWLQQKKREEVRQLLAPIYGWFTEGFDTADLREARALLQQMARTPLLEYHTDVGTVGLLALAFSPIVWGAYLRYLGEDFVRSTGISRTEYTTSRS